ncbi:hypothetical protein H6501_00470 [Candidatus Woesearchaeota archaeon]|nr:hypothetical protein [Candidatus Woesearchaeota archaeon]USN44583.1 MAG: hypothetical protein H6500_01940 [Candidatus Woesearchaeota archaeon]
MSGKKSFGLWALLAAVLLVAGGYVYADSNGVWHRAQDVVAGQFGKDQGGGDFSFPNSVGIGTETPLTDLDVRGEILADEVGADVIHSKSGGNVVIQLG